MILTINTGSSSLKAALYPDDGSERLELAAHAERIGGSGARLRIVDAHGARLFERQSDLPDHAAALRMLVGWLQQNDHYVVQAAGHRVVHGGRDYSAPRPVTPDLLDALRKLVPIDPEHIKPRLPGHWGTSPGLSLIYAHLNRLIRDTNANMISLAGPGHGGPAILANVYLEGTYSEVYPEITQDSEGIRRLFRQFSTPGGVPSHVSVPTPGSIP
jgi:hypothetical protein